MTVEVTDDGLLLVVDAQIDLFSRDNTILLGFTFSTDEDATRYFNAIRASINVGCIHIHVNAGEENTTH